MGITRVGSKVKDMSDDEATRLVVDSVRRLQRVALHPLPFDESVGEEQPMPGDLISDAPMLRQRFLQSLDHLAPSKGRKPIPASHHASAGPNAACIACTDVQVVHHGV
jgi:hypothetical protein